MKSKIWKSIPGYNGYEISEAGAVISFKRNRNGRIMTPTVINRYQCVHLSNDGALKMVKVHRLVALTFIPNPESKPFVNHMDGNKFNNRVENLEWVTHQENVTHGWATGLINTKGDGHPMKKLTSSDVLSIREVYRSKAYTMKELGIIFNVGATNIERIVNRHSWSHI